MRSNLFYISNFSWHYWWKCRSQWPRGLRRRSAAACLQRSWVWIPPVVWKFVCCECRVLSGRGVCDELITRPEESYPLWCVVVCDLETSRMRRPRPALDRSATAKKYICWWKYACTHCNQQLEPCEMSPLVYCAVGRNKVALYVYICYCVSHAEIYYVFRPKTYCNRASTVKTTNIRLPSVASR